MVKHSFHIKYYTKEEALLAIKKDGTAIDLVSAQLKDDYDVVREAIIHGGDLHFASHRLKNDPFLIVLDCKRKITSCLDPLCCNYPEIIFGAKHDKGLLDSYRNIFADWEEFNIEMKLFYGVDYNSPIERYNKFSYEELSREMCLCRKKMVSNCLEVYKKTRKEPYSYESIKRNKRLSLSIRHNTLRFGITSWEKVEKPASYIIDMLEAENNRIKKWVSETAQKTGGSYPERFMFSVLKSMNISFCREQIFPWSKGKRYDFYLPNQNAIIEVHGAQHYEGGFESFGGQNLDYELKNDLEKESLAKKNGIAFYIVVNAMNSSFKFIKNSLNNNIEFQKLFSFQMIDWTLVESLIEEMQKPVPLPLYQAKTEYNNILINLFREEIENHSRAMTFSKETSLMKFFKKCKPSKNGLLPHEILLLEKISSLKRDQIPDHIAIRWKECFQEEITKQITQFLEKGLLCFGDVSNKLDRVNTSILKKVLLDQGLEAKGKKEEVIEQMVLHLSKEQINELVPIKFYELSLKGSQELIDNDYLFTFQGLSLKSKIQIVNAYPNVDYKYLFEDVYKHPRRYLQYLEKEDLLNMGLK